MSHKLLLADDSVTIQRVIELTFADEDIRVTTVSDGQQAIERIEADRPDIVLADVGMPNRDGYEVAAHVKRTPHLWHIPVLLLTGAFEPVDEARASAAGCDGVLAKPFEPQMVINRVKDLLAGGSDRDIGRAGRSSSVAAHEPRFVPPAAAPVLDPVMFDVKLPARDEISVRVSRDLSVFEDLDGPEPATPSPVAASAAAGPSLDEYLDRLDAAFGAGQVSPALTALDEELAVRQSEPERHASAPAAPAAPRTATPERPAPERVFEPVIPAAASPAALAPDEVPSPMASAFSTLLAAERGEAIPSSARLPLRSLSPALVQPSDEVVDMIARRVLDRLSNQEFVSDIVSRVTERVVREEIERLRESLRAS